MFNDKYGLTRAVLEGRKTMTRRVAIEKPEGLYKLLRFKDQCIILKDGKKIVASPYKVGEVIAIAQRYRDVPCKFYREGIIKDGNTYRGWCNKMFVKAKYMPHHIEITHINLKYLQNISDEDCMKEGIKEGEFINTWDRFYFESWGDVPNPITFKTPREAFAALIDKVSGKGSWESNPLVWVYEFKLID